MWVRRAACKGLREGMEVGLRAMPGAGKTRYPGKNRYFPVLLGNSWATMMWDKNPDCSIVRAPSEAAAEWLVQ